MDIGSDHIGVNKGHNATKGLRCRKRSIAADAGDGHCRWVEVLLGSDELGRSSEDLRIIAKLSDNFVGKFKL